MKRCAAVVADGRTNGRVPFTEKAARQGTGWRTPHAMSRARIRVREVNCAAIPRNSSKRVVRPSQGSFTWRARRQGGQVPEGRLGDTFLDEVGDMTSNTGTCCVRSRISASSRWRARSHPVTFA
jgi:hypothetical protein